MRTHSLDLLVQLAGVAQLLLVVASVAIPSVLGWRRELRALSPLTRQVFWTYAGYIWGTNLAFGLLSALAPATLTDGSALARLVGAFIALYWGIRVAVQFGYFDRSSLPERPGVQLADGALSVLFVVLTGVYGAVALGGGAP